MSSPESPRGQQQRVNRPAVAAQACETCRSRKSKCDELRPKCSLCERLDLDCVYREPKPTKKDKSLQQIIEAIQRLDSKVDRIAAAGVPGATPIQPFGISPLQASTPSPHSKLDSSTDSVVQSPIERLSSSSAPVDLKDFPARTNKALRAPANNLSHADRIFTWPAIQKMLLSAGGKCTDELHRILQDGTAYLVAQEQHSHQPTLACEGGLRAVPVRSTPPGGLQSFGIPVTFPGLTQGMMKQYSDLYFNTFNMVYPILDYNDFTMHVIQPVLRTGFGECCVSSVTALVVFALGKLALEGVFGEPVGGPQRGMRGGTTKIPPAIDLFNEARRRIGFIHLQCSLESTQVLLLMCVYYETAQRHIDCWRTTMMASQALVIVLKTQHINWNSHRGDLVRRSFWTCHVLESWYRIDLDLPESRISEYCDTIALPLFTAPEHPISPITAKPIDYQFNFLSMIAIRRAIDRVYTEIYDTNGAETENNFGAPPMGVVQELTRQLEDWRRNLPPSLKWDDDDRDSYLCYEASEDTVPRRAVFTSIPAPTSSRPSCRAAAPPTPNGVPPQASSERPSSAGGFPSSQKQRHASPTSPVPVIETYNADIVAAQMRCRFYYCKVMLYRPFVYKALHYPAELNAAECACVAACINSCLFWPVAMSPPKDKKRLVPNVYVWTQSFVMMLLMLRAAMESEVVRRICEDEAAGGENGEMLRASVRNMLGWVADMALVDGIAEWCWGILEPLYAGFLAGD